MISGGDYYVERTYKSIVGNWTICLKESVVYDASYSSTTTFTYDGGQKTAVTNGQNVSITGTNTATSVGSYTAYVEPQSGHAWSDGSTDKKTISWTINKATNPLTYTEKQSVTQTFSTSAQTATLAAATNGQGTVSYTIYSQMLGSKTVRYFSLSGTTLTIKANTPAGIYKVYVLATAEGNSIYDGGTKYSTVTVTVNRANISPSVTMNGWTYGGTASNPTVSGNTGNGAVTYTYKVKGAADSTYTDTKPTNAGDYTVKATIAATTNYNGGTASKDFTISKQAAPALADAQKPTAKENLAYNGEPQDLVTAPTSLPTGYTVQYSIDNGTTWTDDVPSGTKADNYTVKVKYVGDSNHTTFDGEDIPVTISKQAAPALADAQKPTAKENLAYNGEPQDLVTAPTSLPDGYTGVVYALGTDANTAPSDSLYTTSIPSKTDVGTYYVWYKAVGDENHTDTAGTGPVTVTIEKKNLTVNASDVNAVYDGKPHSIEVKVTGPDKYSIMYGTTEGSYDSDKSPSQISVGTITVYFQVTADNYDTYTGSATVTVTAKEIAPAI